MKPEFFRSACSAVPDGVASEGSELQLASEALALLAFPSLGKS
jgi:hypothetical protein